jgi:peroxiredoxin
MFKLRDIVDKGPVILLLTSSIVLNVALAAKIVRQNQVITRLTPAPVLKPGTQFGLISGKRPDGNPVSVEPGGDRGTVLYVFAPACGWCVRNSDNINVVVRAARQQGLRIIGMSLDEKGIDKFVTDHGLSADLVIIPDEAVRARYGLSGTPQTIVLSDDATVVKNWRGAFVAKTAEDVSRYFDVKLPGLAPAF